MAFPVVVRQVVAWARKVVFSFAMAASAGDAAIGSSGFWHCG